ncbi:hypothetical protein AB8810_10965 [Xanthomonas sp. NCPPB 3005]|uniref:hypothetical protein n=1 Tax=Xanthomonas sp. NCPPB 3005 TaxID=3240913 RepID=UPI0035164A99
MATVQLMALAAIGAVTALAAGEVSAQCCPSGGTVPGAKATTGMGEASPSAKNVSSDPAWGVYQFTRDGIDYVQVNDVYGAVRAAVGRAGDVSWVMPMGVDADRVTITQSAEIGSVIYSSDDFIVRVVKGSDKPSWIVVPRRRN